jgi:hypothetical protein
MFTGDCIFSFDEFAGFIKVGIGANALANYV